MVIIISREMVSQWDHHWGQHLQMPFSPITKRSGWRSAHLPSPPSFSLGMSTTSSFSSGRLNMLPSLPSIFLRNTRTLDSPMNLRKITRFLFWMWPSSGTQINFPHRFIERIHFLECIRTSDRLCQKRTRRAWFLLFFTVHSWFVRHFSPFIRRSRTSRKIFSKNGYPSKLVDKCIFNFFNKQYEKRAIVHTVPKKELFLVLPFLGANSWKTKNELIRTFRKIVPFCNLKIVYKTTRRLSSCFTFKDKIPKSLMSGVIYRYTCAECNLSYVGCTKRFWEKRLEEHLHVSGLTGKPRSGMIVFAPLQHVKSDCCAVRKISREDFEIIGHEKDPYLLELKESIIISTSRPKLNGNVRSVPLSLFWP